MSCSLVWKLDLQNAHKTGRAAITEFEPIGQLDVDARITSLAVSYVRPEAPQAKQNEAEEAGTAVKKRKREADEPKGKGKKKSKAEIRKKAKQNIAEEKLIAE